MYACSMTTNEITPTDEQVAAFNAVLYTPATRSRIASMLRSGYKCYDGMIVADCDCRINPRTFRTGCDH